MGPQEEEAAQRGGGQLHAIDSRSGGFLSMCFLRLRSVGAKSVRMWKNG